MGPVVSFREGLTAPQSWVDFEPGLQGSGQAALGAGHQYWWLSALPSLPGLAGQGGTLATGLAPLQLRGRAEPQGSAERVSGSLQPEGPRRLISLSGSPDDTWFNSPQFVSPYPAWHLT